MAGLDFSSRAQQSGASAGALDFSHRAAEPVTWGEDIGRSLASGVYDTLASVGAQVNPARPILDMIDRAAKNGGAVLDLIQGRVPKNGREAAAMLAQTLPGPVGADLAQAQTRIAKQDYIPQTRTGRAAKTAGQMAPAALAPGSLPQRAAAVILPTVGTEGAGALAKALGASQDIEDAARFAGGLAGGLAASVRLQPKTVDLPADDASAMRYVDKVAGERPLAEVAAAPDIATGAEALGQPGKAALASLARREGATGDALNAEVASRQIGRPGRLLDAFAEASGVQPEAAAGDIKSLVTVGRAKAAPLYEQAYATGPIDSPALRSLAQRPSVKAALVKAVKIAAEDDKSPDAIGLEVSPASGDIPEMVSIKSPTAETWDYVKRGLDDVLDGYRDKTTGRLVLDTLGQKTRDTLDALRKELTDANPAYAKALATSGDYLSADSAFRSAGKDIFNSNLTETQFAEKFGKLSESSQSAYRGGIANRFYDLAQTGRLDPKVIKTPRVQAKLRTALGEAGAKSLIDMAGREGDMLAFERRYAPGAGSITQEMAAAMAEQDATGRGAQMAGDFAGGLIKGHGVGGAATGAISRQLQALLDAVGPTRGMSVEARNAAGQTLLLPPGELAKAIAAYRALPKSQPLEFKPGPALLNSTNVNSRPAR